MKKITEHFNWEEFSIKDIEKKGSVWERKVSAPIPKSDLRFSCTILGSGHFCQNQGQF